jgi:hypothetical protein
MGVCSGGRGPPERSEAQWSGRHPSEDVCCPSSAATTHAVLPTARIICRRLFGATATTTTTTLGSRRRDVIPRTVVIAVAPRQARVRAPESGWCSKANPGPDCGGRLACLAKSPRAMPRDPLVSPHGRTSVQLAGLGRQQGCVRWHPKARLCVWWEEVLPYVVQSTEAVISGISAEPASYCHATAGT